jgi:glycosyltransferase involved in cell wall biosynthesis
MSSVMDLQKGITMSEDRVKVLYIGGYSRSGSTLLLRLLGRIEGLFSVGELWDLWQRSFIENQLCGCGQPFKECPFWTAVVQQVFGGFDQANIPVLQALRDAVQGNHSLPALAIPRLRTVQYTTHLHTYTDILQQLYRAIQQVSGSRMIVDSSKVPPYAFLLQEAPEIELHLVHLVRDSRAAAYSWQRKKVRPEIHWRTAYMERYNPVRAALEWTVMNGLFHGRQARAASYQRVRYEDLCELPRETLVQIGAGLGEDWTSIDFFGEGHSVQMGVDHTVSGNPNRFQQGAIQIRPDTEWQQQMAWHQKAIVTGLTWPLLQKYGYLNQRCAAAEIPPSEQQSAAPQEAYSTLSKPTPLRVLLVTARYLPYIGGTEVHTYEMANRLVTAGHDVTVLTTDPGRRLEPREESRGVRIIRVQAWPADGDYYFAPGIYRTIMQGNWDLVHCQGYHSFVAPLAMLAAWQAKIPYVVTFHSGGHSSRIRNSLRGMQRAMLRPLLARSERLIAVSEFESKFFRERLRLPSEQFVVIPNGAYMPNVDDTSVPNTDGRLIVSVGRLERYKGHHRVIAALPKVIAQCPDVHLRIVGTGPYEGNLRRIARELGVADRVEIRAVSGSDRGQMASVLLGATLVILLSDYESQSISVMEALALGRPVLVADTSALHELAVHGLVQATPLGGTADEVAAAMLDQLYQPLVPGKLDLPTWDACFSQLSALYYNVIRRVQCAF